MSVIVLGGVFVPLVTGGCRRGSTLQESAPLVVSAEQHEVWERDFNPFRAVFDARWPTSAGVYEPLMIYNRLQGEWVPWLATDYAWDKTDRELTFTLRPEVRWSDGTGYSAEDVEFTFDIMRTHRELDLNNVWDSLDDVRIDDEHHVTFVFQNTFVPGFEQVALQSIIPKHIWKDVADPVGFMNENPIGTGPFTEVRRFENEVFELGRNPHYWQPGKPMFDTLRLPLFRNNDEAVGALLAGDVDWSGNFVTDAERSFVAQDPEHRSCWSPLVAGPVLLYANTARPPFDDADVRKAISMAIDREVLVREAMEGLTRPADASGLDDSLKRYQDPEAIAQARWAQFDRQAVGQELDRLGFVRGADGQRGPAGGPSWEFEIIVPDGWTDWVAASRLIAEQLAVVGISMSVQPLPFDQWFERVRVGSYDLSLGGGDESVTPYGLYRRMMATETVRPVGEIAEVNWHRLGDSEADAILEAFELTSDEVVQEEILRLMQRRFLDLAPAIPLFLMPSWSAINTARFVGFPSEEDPYAAPSPTSTPERLLVLTRIQPRAR